MIARGLSSGELSRRTGGAFSPRTIFRWRAGDTAPGIEALPLLVNQLGVSADWLIGVSERGGIQTNNNQGTERDDQRTNHYAGASN